MKPDAQHAVCAQRDTFKCSSCEQIKLVSLARALAQVEYLCPTTFLISFPYDLATKQRWQQGRSKSPASELFKFFFFFGAVSHFAETKFSNAGPQHPYETRE